MAHHNNSISPTNETKTNYLRLFLFFSNFYQFNMGEIKLSKQLKITDINKHHKTKYSKIKTITLSVEDDEFNVDLQLKFKPTSIQKFIVEYSELIEQLKTKGVSSEVVKDVTFLYYILLIKHFTNVDNIPKDIEKMVIVCEEFIDLGILEMIISEFPQEEIKKLEEFIKKIETNSKLIGNQIGELFVDAAIKESDQDGIQ